ncbi:MAG: phytanoyl-CoA dioxygenase family protein, partial [Alphaproteobacteria bacterium]|nr:phytanoyl-CoA dioxygenase family protein [Alphaproteobacteria bacterium]
MPDAAQRRDFETRGVLVLTGALNADEIAALDAAAGDLAYRDGPEVAREADGAPHVIYGAHLWDARIAALAAHPTIHTVARDLLGGPYFIHQSRLNLKQPNGSVVAWHQDFATYHRVDGIPDARGLVIGVLIDSVGPENAPVIVLPGSHREGIVSEAVIDETVPDHAGAARYRYDIPAATIARLSAAAAPEAVLGPAGTVFFMHANLVHGSSVNILPARRAIAYVNVSPCDNRGES